MVAGGGDLLRLRDLTDGAGVGPFALGGAGGLLRHLAAVPDVFMRGRAGSGNILFLRGLADGAGVGLFALFRRGGFFGHLTGVPGVVAGGGDLLRSGGVADGAAIDLLALICAGGFLCDDAGIPGVVARGRDILRLCGAADRALIGLLALFAAGRVFRYRALIPRVVTLGTARYGHAEVDHAAVGHARIADDLVPPCPGAVEVDILQAGCGERVVADAGDAVRDGQRRQIGAVVKRAVRNGRHAAVRGDLAVLASEHDGVGFPVDHAVPGGAEDRVVSGDGDGADIGALGKRRAGQFYNIRRDEKIGDAAFAVQAAGERRIGDGRHRRVGGDDVVGAGSEDGAAGDVVFPGFRGISAVDSHQTVAADKIILVARRHRDGFQLRAAVKRPIPKPFKAGGKMQRPQAVAAGKGVVHDAFYPLRDRDLDHVNAGVEGVPVDRVCGFGDDRLLQVFQPGERAGADGGNAVFDHDGNDKVFVLIPSRLAIVIILTHCAFAGEFQHPRAGQRPFQRLLGK